MEEIMEELPLLCNTHYDDVTEEHVFQGNEQANTCTGAHKDDNDNAEDFKYDVFISYSKNDRPWVKDVLLHTLEQEDKKVCVDYRDFQPGVPVTDNVVHAIENSSVTVLVLTPAFVESEWCMYESKQALVSSLATAKARVLPLILMECNMPNILKHLTYLDHTSEDVQPYFKEQLIHCLNNAGKWIPASAGNHLESDIVPISEVQQVVTRSLDQDKKYEIAVKKLMGAFHSLNTLKRGIKCCIVLPFCIFCVVYLSFIIIYIADFASEPLRINSLTPSYINSTSSNMFFGYKISDTEAKYCEILSINDRTLVDFWGFDDLSKSVLYEEENSTHLETSLHPMEMFQQNKFRILGDMTMITKFCFRSGNSSKQNSTLRLYKPTGIFDFNQFDRTSDPKYVFEGVKYKDYEASASESFCLTSEIKAQSLTASAPFSAFVFYNIGKTSLFLNLTTTFKTPTLRKSSTILTCHNVSECKLPLSPRIRYIIVSKNISAPYYGANEISVNCTYLIPVVYNSIISVIFWLLQILLIYLLIRCFNKTCSSRLQNWYFGKAKVREELGETAIQMIEESPDLNALYNILKEEKKKREFTI